ncbi:UNKNOWN [Stylonychia lemnae]|uniref:Uncharacterized protein n=1 Tax=Stylonychia lemnae TaxID=5949 RepID=A0A078ACD6_STYLE|nr:UNKNOWN [Stylonychia lemnae]|eukprot:CDW79506.1 UNKNOWN [Stylonychia lemnae]
MDFNNFDLAFGIKFVQNSDRHRYENETVSKYLNISFQYYNVTYYKSEEDGQLETERSIITIPYERCQQNRFLGKTQEMEKIGLDRDGWFCISDLDANVIGQEMSLIRKIVRITVSPCQNNTQTNSSQTTITNINESILDSNNDQNLRINNNSQICASEYEISQYIHKVQFMVAYINKYFDQDDFKEPIKSEIQVQFYNAQEGFAFNSILNVQKNYLVTHDHWFSDIFSSELYEFFSVEQTKTVFGSIKPGVWEMFNVLIYCKDQEFYIERQVTTVAQIMTLVGGFMNILFLIARLLTKIYNKQVFYWDLINKIFKFENPEKSLKQNHDNKYSIYQHRDQFNKKDLKEKVFSKIHSKKYKGVRDICKFYLMQCRKTQSYNYHYYQNGSQKLDKILDIASLLKTVRKTKQIAKLLLKKSQYSLVPYMSYNTLPFHEIQSPQKITNSKQIMKEQKRNLEQHLTKICSQYDKKLSQEIIDDICQVKKKNQKLDTETKMSANTLKLDAKFSSRKLIKKKKRRQATASTTCRNHDIESSFKAKIVPIYINDFKI